MLSGYIGVCPCVCLSVCLGGAGGENTLRTEKCPNGNEGDSAQLVGYFCIIVSPTPPWPTCVSPPQFSTQTNLCRLHIARFNHLHPSYLNLSRLHTNREHNTKSQVLGGNASNPRRGRLKSSRSTWSLGLGGVVFFSGKEGYTRASFFD